MWISKITLFKRHLVCTNTGIHLSYGRNLNSHRRLVSILRRTDQCLLVKVNLQCSDSENTPEPSHNIIEMQL
jgi:hypothetical protein